MREPLRVLVEVALGSNTTATHCRNCPFLNADNTDGEETYWCEQPAFSPDPDEDWPLIYDDERQFACLQASKP